MLPFLISLFLIAIYLGSLGHDNLTQLTAVSRRGEEVRSPWKLNCLHPNPPSQRRSLPVNAELIGRTRALNPSTFVSEMAEQQDAGRLLPDYTRSNY